MTAEGDIIRDRRRAFAAPGGSHDRIVRLLSVWLPAGVGVLSAVMILAPLSPRGEVSFLLDRNKVAITNERLRVNNAMYRGVDSSNRAFSVTAGSAVQASAKVSEVRMDRLVAQIILSDGPAQLTAPSGIYDFANEVVRVGGNVLFTTADGYRMVTRNVSINLQNRRVTGDGGVDGTIPAGTFSANRISADLDERTVALEGNARLHMVPGQLRMPQ